ncbi:hypothetical protein [Brevundimonas sp.]|uniref:hypothetical protein n=1 Tax=Brevundimonas sp. TaxID=1871086 RepID=UPI00272FB79F|nr:hypothetical protein [Brevundimonas sp.]MDP1913979.1 hypothetical protein [Brevundimonas sp.]
MKLPRILVLGALVASIASAASAQTIHHWGPQPFGYQYTHYINGQLASINYMGCNGTETWDGYNGYPDLTYGDTYDYVEWEC